jgi:hypothetical protein
MAPLAQGDELGFSDLLRSHQVRLLNGQWDDDGVWHDIRLLAARFWAARSDDRVVAWHHLLLGVGNFKRQGGRLHPPPLPARAPDVSPAPLPEEVDIPQPGGLTRTLKREEQHTWEQLLGVNGGVKGLGVATTTLLAALWPDRHFIFDRRVIAAAQGLRLAVGRPGIPEPFPDPESDESVPTTLQAYAIVRRWAIDTIVRLSADGRVSETG